MTVAPSAERDWESTPADARPLYESAIRALARKDPRLTHTIKKMDRGYGKHLYRRYATNGETLFTARAGRQHRLILAHSDRGGYELRGVAPKDDKSLFPDAQ